MNQTFIAFAACGAAGALIYSFPAYLKAMSNQPPIPLALATLLFSLFTGTITAILFTQLIGYHWPWTVQPQPWPLAAVIGLGSNPLVPVLVRRLERWVDAFGENG